jgi:hypothetical protein
MSGVIEVRPFDLDLAQFVFERVRPSDRKELGLIGNKSAKDFEAAEAYVGLIEGEPLGVWGVMVHQWTAHFFYFSRPEAEPHKRKIARFAKRFVHDAAAKYWDYQLQVIADDQNQGWLKWMGFGPTKHMIRGLRIYVWNRSEGY